MIFKNYFYERERERESTTKKKKGSIIFSQRNFILFFAHKLSQWYYYYFLFIYTLRLIYRMNVGWGRDFNDNNNNNNNNDNYTVNISHKYIYHHPQWIMNVLNEFKWKLIRILQITFLYRTSITHQYQLHVNKKFSGFFLDAFVLAKIFSFSFFAVNEWMRMEYKIYQCWTSCISNAIASNINAQISRFFFNFAAILFHRFCFVFILISKFNLIHFFWTVIDRCN